MMVVARQPTRGRASLRPGVFQLSWLKRNRLLQLARRARDPGTALRFRFVARAGVVSCNQAAAEFGVVPSTVIRAVQRYVEGGVNALYDQRSGNGERKVDAKFLRSLESLLLHMPQDLGWTRTTWTRELLAKELANRGFPQVSTATMGRALACIGARLGAAKPIVLCPWPRKRRLARLATIRRIVRRASSDEPVFYEDEVDIHLNPKIGRDWMPKGFQRRVVTPGKNKKHYVAGALNAATGELTWVESASKSSALFIKLVFKLLNQFKHAQRLHIVLDNYIIHSSMKTQRALAQFRDRVVLHFLPPYTPDANRIERKWRDLHGSVTRNHKRRTIEELMDDVRTFLRQLNRRARQELRAASRDAESRAAI